MHRDSLKTTRSTGSNIDYNYISLKSVFFFFKLLGLAPWNIGEKKYSSEKVTNKRNLIEFKYSKIGVAYNFFLIVGCTGINVVSLPALGSNEYPYKTELTTTIEMAQAVCGNTITIVLRIMLCIRQKKVIKLFNRLIEIDKTIVRLGNDRNVETNRLFVAIIFFVNILIWIAATLTETQCYEFDGLTLFNDIIPGTIINWFIVEYVIVLKLIEKRFKALNRILLDCSRSSIVQPIQSAILGELTINTLRCPKIINLRRTHTILYEVTCHFAEFFSPLILITIALTCFSTIYNAYYLIMPFVMQLDFDKTCMIVNSMFWLTGLMLPIVMMSTGVDRTNDEMNKTAEGVHRLLARSTTSREDKAELQQFSLELLQRDVEFSACGLFPLNCTLIHSIFGMVVTYLIILFQFQMAGH